MYRVAGLLLVCLASCSVERVEHDATANAAGTLDVTLHLAGGGEHTGQAMVCAGLPSGWVVESASFSATSDGANQLSGTAVRWSGQESWFGSNPAVSWSCWVHDGTQSWTDAASGQVDLVVRIPADAAGRADLSWTLGSAGTLGEYISARAQTVVTVNQGAHPLDSLSQDNGGLQVSATGVHPDGFVAVSDTALLVSDDGVNWASVGAGLSGATAVGANADGIYAVANGQLWSHTTQWQAVTLTNAATVDSLFMTGSNGVAAGQTEALDRGMWALADGGVQELTVPEDIVDGALSVQGDHAVWLAWDREDRVHYAWVRTGLDGTWEPVSGPDVGPAQAVTDRVGVGSDGTLLWVRGRTDSTGSSLHVYESDSNGDWLLIGGLPTGDLATPNVPQCTDTGWLFYDGWGAVWSVEDQVVLRHPLGRTPTGGRVVVSGDEVVWVEDGRPIGTAEWVAAPSIEPFDLQSGRVGESYSVEIPVQDGMAVDVVGLPAGLNIYNQRIVGTPEQAGVFDITMMAHDAWGREAVAGAELAIADAILPDEPIDTDTDVDTEEPGEADTDSWQDETEGTDAGTHALDDDTGFGPSVTGSGCSSVPMSAGWFGLVVSGLLLRRRR